MAPTRMRHVQQSPEPRLPVSVGGEHRGRPARRRISEDAAMAGAVRSHLVWFRLQPGGLAPHPVRGFFVDADRKSAGFRGSTTASLLVIVWDDYIQMALSELRAGAVHERAADPVHLFRASLDESYPADARTRRTVYVPAYSMIRIMSGRSRVDLATTLSIHNTSRDKPLLLELVDHHNTDGGLIQAYLDEPVAIKPLGTIEIFVAHEDHRAGMGANFVVDWAADGPITEPVIEAVMIGTQGTATYSFVSQGRSTRIVQPE
jgi:Protein of unknown function (DUF3124)